MSGRLHYQEHTIEEVFNFFADAFESPKGEVITKVTPHYDPRRGSVIFQIYVEPSTEEATPDSDPAEN